MSSLSGFTQPHRLPQGGRLDRSQTLSFTVDGQPYQGHPGDTLTSALLANGVIGVGPSIYVGRPRGVLAAGVEEPNALVTVDRPGQSVSESMLPATTVELVDGLAARFVSGIGALDPGEDAAFYDKKHVHTDVLVIGGGPAGLSAAREAASSGARVVLVDDQPELGGSLLSQPGTTVYGVAAPTWLSGIEAQLRKVPDVTVLTRTSAIGSYDEGYVVALENRTDHLGLDAATLTGVSRQRLWHIRAQQVVVATGAHERPLVFANNDRPGVMLASAVRTYLNRYGVAAGTRVVLATTNDSIYSIVPELQSAGVEVVAVVDARPTPSAAAQASALVGVEVLTSSAVVDVDGEDRVTAALVGAIDDEGTPVGRVVELACDLVAVSGGWSPVVHLHSQRQGRLRFDDDLVAFVPDGDVEGQQVVGASRGSFALEDCLAEGARAGAAASFWAGFVTVAGSRAIDVAVVSPRATGTTRPLWLVRAADGTVEGLNTHFVDLQRDQTVADVVRATGAGLRSVEHIKRYTSIGTAADQGKTSAVNAIGLVMTALQEQGGAGAVGTTTYRAPYVPVAFAALAGRNRGDLFEPARRTPVHGWHVERGAEFEAVGQWLRPWYYPLDGETMDETVLRECTAARTSVAMMDASTLGKIEVWGADAGEFLNRIYTNAFKKLPVGSARYGVMCSLDGMVLDDGVTLRLDDSRYFITTTTGGAAHVLDWLEEWHQTEWSDLDVSFTSVTEQWTTVAVVGPRSREVVGRIAPDLDVDNEAFPFMTFRETVLASGAAARVCRISFSGELAFEVNVAGWYGRQVWEDIYEAGSDFGITPYGTETMHVLRAEKGYPIIGQDTDGTTTPHDLGMVWVVSKVKEFVGKRSHARSDTARPDRKHLVSLLPADPSFRLPEGTQVIELGVSPDPDDGRTPMLGHVTSSYHSAALGRSFALALINNGRNRAGQTLSAVVGDGTVDVVVGDPVLFDPEGTRRDG